MKKIISALLLVGCIFAFASCNLLGGSQTPPVDNEGEKQTLELIQTCIDDSAPKRANISVLFSSEIGSLNGSYNVAYHTDGSATVEYSYELFNTIDPSSGLIDPKSTYTGVVNVSADGELDSAINGVASVEALAFDISLDEKKIATYTVETGILQATVKSKNTIDIIGVDIPYDITLNIRTANGKVTAVVITYETYSGTVEITAAYHY